MKHWLTRPAQDVTLPDCSECGAVGQGCAHPPRVAVLFVAVCEEYGVTPSMSEGVWIPRWLRQGARHAALRLLHHRAERCSPSLNEHAHCVEDVCVYGLLLRLH